MKKPYWLIGLMLLWAAGLVWAKEKPAGFIVLKYTRPAKYDIPEKIKAIGVADFVGQSGGDRQWSDIATDALVAELQKTNAEFNRFRLVDRKHIKGVLAEQDLAAAGVVDAAGAAKMGKIVGAQAMIFGRVHCTHRVVRGRKKKVNLLGSAFSRRPRMKSVATARLQATASVNFTMVDTTTGAVLASHLALREYKPDHKDKGVGALFGSDVDETKLGDPNFVLPELLKICVREIIGQITEHQIEVKVPLAKSKKPKSAKKGLALALVGQYDMAREAFEQAVKQRAKDAKIWYNLGVMAEAHGDLKKALNCYTEALDRKVDPMYTSAIARVK